MTEEFHRIRRLPPSGEVRAVMRVAAIKENEGGD
jgi:hypothetical protein